MKEKPLYFYSLDLLRATCAFTILILHYQWFTDYDAIVTLPFSSVLFAFYSKGFWAVPMFWMISGFVFAFIYLDQRVNFKTFFINRFSRLYPLHFVTLIVIACLFIISNTWFDSVVGTPTDNVYHFFLHLFMASNWGFEDTFYSYNAVIWSVSMEVVIYVIYFAALPYIRQRPFLITLLLFLISVRMNYYSFSGAISAISGCAIYFFGGIFVYLLASKLKKHFFILLSISFALFAVVFLGFNRDYLPLTAEINIKIFQLAALIDFFTFIAQYMHTIKYFVVFFATLLVFAAVVYQQWCERFGKLCRWLGNLTYSIYLCTFPLIYLVQLLFYVFGIDQSVYYYHGAFIFWIALNIVVARLAFVYIEKPTQTFIRQFEWDPYFQRIKKKWAF